MKYTLRVHVGCDPAEVIGPLEGELRRAFNRDSVVRRERFLMTERLAREVAEGKKSTTIRVDRDALEFPASDVLPLFSVGAGAGLSPAGSVRVSKVVYKRIRDLTETDARRDGFASRSALVDALTGFYGKLRDDEPVSIYDIAATRPLAAEPALAFRSRSRSQDAVSAPPRRRRGAA